MAQPRMADFGAWSRLPWESGKGLATTPPLAENICKRRLFPRTVHSGRAPSHEIAIPRDLRSGASWRQEILNARATE